MMFDSLKYTARGVTSYCFAAHALYTLYNLYVGAFIVSFEQNCIYIYINVFIKALI